MAFHRLPSDTELTETLHPCANENLGLFGHAVPSLKPLDANRSALCAQAGGTQDVDLNDNDTIAARHDLTLASEPDDGTESHRTVRPIVAIRQSCAEMRSQADEWQASPSRTETRILWSVILVAVMAIILIIASDG